MCTEIANQVCLSSLLLMCWMPEWKSGSCPGHEVLNGTEKTIRKSSKDSTSIALSGFGYKLNGYQSNLVLFLLYISSADMHKPIFWSCIFLRGDAAPNQSIWSTYDRNQLTWKQLQLHTLCNMRSTCIGRVVNVDDNRLTCQRSIAWLPFRGSESQLHPDKSLFEL